MTGLRFSKMHGAGNDFVMLDCRQQAMPLGAAQIRALGDRHTGVGFDQLISIEASDDPACAFAYRVWNADGTSAGQCGNGVRCVAAWLHRDGTLALGSSVALAGPSGNVSVQLQDARTVTVGMGEPVFEPARIPFLADAVALEYPLRVDEETLAIGAASMGNPHAVVEVAELGDPGLQRLGPLLTRHPRFPQGCNAGFVETVNRGHLRLRVHERGAGWTLACGSGACAAAAVLRRRGRIDADVRVDLPGGALHVSWPGAGAQMWMTGPAAFVAEGEWQLPEPPR